MIKPRKDDLIYAFKAKQRKRNHLLYAYYKDSYFTDEYNAVYAASLIYQELGIEITPNMVYKIRSRNKSSRKGSTSLPAVSEAGKMPLSSQRAESRIQEALIEHAPKSYVLKNEEEYPAGDPYKGQLDDL